jgi:hypothetical protein
VPAAGDAALGTALVLVVITISLVAPPQPLIANTHAASAANLKAPP